MVVLRPLELTQQHVADAVVIGSEQERFAGGSLDRVFQALQASAAPRSVHPFAISDHSQVVGFFVLREVPVLPPWAWEHTITLHSFRVSTLHQGKGYGIAALKLAARWIRAERPGIPHMMLTVNADNEDAGAFYHRCGFHPTGSTFQGLIGRERVMMGVVDEIGRCRSVRG